MKTIKVKFKLTEVEIKKREEIGFDLFLKKLDDPNFKMNHSMLQTQKQKYILSQLDDSTFDAINKYDLTKVLCPNCNKNQFYYYNVTDEHDTYAGIKCQNCRYDYSFTH
jgi:DNA-directed RNA polymerase subunit M/transcription elongation factor TFIIS